MRFLVDAQLPPALCEWLREKGHDADHVADVGLLSADDEVIWRYASENSCILLTKDEDFIAIRHGAETGATVCWLRVGNASNSQLSVWLDKVFPAMVAAIETGEVSIELR